MTLPPTCLQPWLRFRCSTVNMQCAQQQEEEFRRPLVYIPSQFSVSATSASNLCMEVDGNVSHGTKRKSDEDNDTLSVDELQATLLNTSISKLTATMANGSRHRRTLRHSVLIHNMLRSLECVGNSQNVELQSQRARITARRPSADNRPQSTTDSTSSASVELSNSSNAKKQQQQVEAFFSQQKHQQSLEHLSSWKQEQQPELFAPPCEPHHQLELLPSSVDIDNSEVMSSPTATFCPLLTVELTAEEQDKLQSALELETLDVSSDYDYLYNTDLNFFEQSLPFCKTAEISSCQ